MGIYIGAGAERRMRGGFHAGETLARFPRCASVCRLTDTRMSGSVGQFSTLHGRLWSLVCMNERKNCKRFGLRCSIKAAIYQKNKQNSCMAPPFSSSLMARLLV